MHKSCSNKASFLILVWLSIACGGCASLPDVGPFVDATLELRSGVATIGYTVEAELRQTKDGQPFADRLKKAWIPRVNAIDALVAYAESLRDIVQAGRKGGEVANSLANSVTNLAQVVGVAMPSAEVIGVSTDTAAFIYSHIAIVQASKSLEEALVNAQPAIERISAMIAYDLQELDGILRTASAHIVSTMRVGYQVELGFRNRLISEQKELYRKTSLSPTEEGRLIEIYRLLESTKAWYIPLQTEIEQAEKRLHLGRSLIQVAVRVIQQWATAHKQLVLAVGDGRSVNSKVLLQAALEIRDLIIRMREL